MFYSQVILAKKGPLAKVWLAAHWGDKKLARPQIFATDISQSCTDIMNPSVPLALRLSGHLLLGVVRIYSRKVKYVLNDCTEAMLKLQMAFAKQQQQNQQQQLQLQQQNQQHQSSKDGNVIGRELLITMDGQQQQQNNQQHHNQQQQLVQNFGEFDQVHVVEGFCLPLPEDNEWILADDDDDDDDEINNFNNNPNNKNNRHQSDLLLAAHLPTNNQVNTFHNNDEEEEEEEETWAPFDPDNENDDDEENENENKNNESRVSDIEIVRAANESFLSEDQTRRSSILDKSALTTDTPTATGTPNKQVDGEEFDFDIPFGDDDDDEDDDNANVNNNNINNIINTSLDDSALQLSKDGDAGTPLNHSANGLAMDDENENTENTNTNTNNTNTNDGLLATSMSKTTTHPLQNRRKRRRKRRKVVIDNHETELTNDHIRSMLQNTDDIVRPMIHPASIWDDNDDDNNNNHDNNHDNKYVQLVLEERWKQEQEDSANYNNYSGSSSSNNHHHKRRSKSKRSMASEQVPVLTQPFLQDGSTGSFLHPKLQQLWKDNYWKALGETCPYSKQKQADDIEGLRRDAGDNDDDDDDSNRSTSSIAIDASATPVHAHAHSMKEAALQEELDFPQTTIDDDDDEEEEDEMDLPVPDFGDDDEETGTLKRKSRGFDNDDGADDDDEDLLDLGMVNDMVLDSDEEAMNSDNEFDDDENNNHNSRQSLGDVASSSTKWHKHTVRVYKHLKKCIQDPNRHPQEQQDPQQQQKQLADVVEFGDLTKHVVSRRNASSIFFELLQLKTWDFIEVDQDESYGRIAISAGLRFGEDAPNN